MKRKKQHQQDIVDLVFDALDLETAHREREYLRDKLADPGNRSATDTRDLRIDEAKMTRKINDIRDRIVGKLRLS